MRRTMFIQTALIVALTLVAALASAQQAPANPKVMTINGEPLWAAEITFVLQSAMAPLLQQGHQGPPPEELVESVVQKVVDTKLLAQEARRLKIKPDEKQIKEILARIEQSSGGRAALEANLASGGTDYATLEKTIRDRELARALIDQQVAPSAAVSDDEVRKFYDDNSELFVIQDQVRARHIVIKAEGVGAEADAAALQRAEAARKRALAGEDFGELANELSDGPSAPMGGDLGFFIAEQMEAAFAEAAFALQPGEISEVVKTRFGYHVIKVEERREGGEKVDFDKVAADVRKVVEEQKHEETVATLLTRLTEAAEIVHEEDAGLPVPQTTPQ